MAEVLISYERSASMTESEMLAWFTERASVRQPAFALPGPNGSDSQPLLLRFEVQADSVQGADEQLTDLMTDMRLLGLCPTIVSPIRRPEDG